LKQGNALSPRLFNFALDYAIRWVQVNEDGLKFNGTHQLLVYADDVINILGGSVRTTQRNTEAVAVASNKVGLEMLIKVYGHVSRSECSQNIKTENSSLERVKQLKFLGTTLINQYYIQEEIKSTMMSVNYLLSFGAECCALQFAIQKYKN